jgi:hypothetical protein
VKPNRANQIKGNIKHPGHTPPGKWLGEPMTKPEARHMAGANARAEYNPTIRQIKGQIRGSGQRQQDISGWYNGLTNQINQSAGETANASAAAQAAMQAQMEAAAKSAQGNQAAIAGQNADFAKLVGADPAAFAPGAQTQAAAANQRQLMSAALAAPIAAAGANQVGYFGAQGVNARRDEIAQHLAERKRTLSMKQDLSAARKERGQKAVANFGELRQNEIDNSLKRKAFGLEKKQTAIGNAQKSRELSVAQSKEAREVAENAEENRRKNEAQRNENVKTKREGKKGGKTQSERNEVKAGKENALATVHSFVQAHGLPKSSAAKAELEREVAKESEVSPAEAAWAVNRYLKRHGQRAENVFTEPPHL